MANILNRAGRWLRPEAHWLGCSWRQWQEVIDAWIEEHHPSRADELLLRLLWFEDASHLDRLWRRYRTYHRLLRVSWIVSGVITPVLVQAGEPTLATVFGAIAGVAGGLDGFFNWSQRIRIQRRTADRLKDEGTAFLTGSGPYDSDIPTNLTTFKHRLAAITAEHRRDYDEARDEDARARKVAPTSHTPQHDGSAREETRSQSGSY
jgi:hypothetical protein